MNMNIFKYKNLRNTLIALIIIFGVIFIIVGERPRHKAPVEEKTSFVSEVPVPNNKSAAKPQPENKPTEKSPLLDNNQDSATTSINTVTTPSSDSPLTNINAKDIINKKYQDSDNKEIFAAALQARKNNKPITGMDVDKSQTDDILSEAGLTETSDKLTPSSTEQEKIQRAEGSPKESSHDMLQLSDPKTAETINNPAILKEQSLQEKHPKRYTTKSFNNDSIIYAIDTSTSEVWVLSKNATAWTELGKPVEATEKANSTYILEGVAADSAVVFDTSTAHTWRVTYKGSDIKWATITPFPNNSK